VGATDESGRARLEQHRSLAKAGCVRHTITPELRAEVVEIVAAVLAASKLGQPSREAWLARPLPGSAAQVACVLADEWLGYHDLLSVDTYVFAQGLRMCLEIDDPLVAWGVADLMCRYPRRNHDPIRIRPGLAYLLDELPPTAEYAIVERLGAMLSPETPNNRVALYDWLVTRDHSPAHDCPAIMAGLASTDAAIRRICERLLAGPPPAQPWSLAALREACTPISVHKGSVYFELVAVDHLRKEWLTVAHHSELEETRIAEQLGRALAASGRPTPDELVRSVVEHEVRNGSPEPCALDMITVIERPELREQIVLMIMLGAVTRSDSIAMVDAILALLGSTLECRVFLSNLRGSMSNLWTLQDPNGVFSLVILCLSCQ
jgi:hypothetical protein